MELQLSCFGYHLSAAVSYVRYMMNASGWSFTKCMKLSELIDCCVRLGDEVDKR